MVHSPLIPLAGVIRAACMAALAAQASEAWAQAEAGDGAGTGMADAPMLREVVVTARRSIEQRFMAAGSLVVIDRRDIEQMGADTVGDLLRQLPGVQVTTNASGGIELRMRGMDASATRVLVDGQRATGRAQLSFDQLPAELIERIEVLRAPTAEYAGATGGTINFVLRQASARRETTVRLTNNHVWDRNAAQFFFSRSGPLGAPADPSAPAPASPWSYFVAVSGGELLLGSDVRRHTFMDGLPSAEVDADTRIRRAEWTLLPRLQGRLSAADQIHLRGTLTSTEFDGRHRSRRAGPGFTAVRDEDSLTRRHHGMAAIDWTHRFEASKLETTWSGARTTERVDRRDGQAAEGEVVPPLLFDEDRRDQQWSAKAKLTGTGSPLLWSLGAEAEQRRLNVRTLTLTGEAGLSQASRAQATQRRLAVWTDREWELPGRTTLTLGLRGEAVRSQAAADGLPASARQGFVQPSLHTRTPIGDDLQWRANLARITRLPRVWDLVDRSIPSQGGNSLSNPDTEGNPALRPETAWALDTGFERRLPGQGLWGVSVFVRSIDDVLASTTRLAESRWVSRRENVGDALAWGLESELKTGLGWLGLGDDWTLSANGSLLQSRMTRGADRGARIPGQARYTATLGVARPVRRSGGWFGGATLTLTGPSQLRAVGLSGRERSRAALDVYVGNGVRGLGYWRLGVFNVGDAPYRRARGYLDAAGHDTIERSSLRLTPRVYLSAGTQF